MLPRKFNDLLALFILALIFILWLLHGMKRIALPETIIGVTISTWTTIVMFYYRKRPPKED